jgi:predicted transcriptional regulator
MKIDRLMCKEVSTCAPDDTLNEAARVMWERDCGMVPTVDGEKAARRDLADGHRPRGDA